MRISMYQMYRGKCHELSQALVELEPDLRLVRGHYICPIWGAQTHWWTEDKNGKIIDPTKMQFPSRGIGQYLEFDGVLTCEMCGKTGSEDSMIIGGVSHVYCSAQCYTAAVL